ncbi:MAG TPA: hypothetical protein VFJ94_03930 [Intrasporangium sp.]|uniref:hypothetical protein n=1 Tax=Intrasporangium sp. TaxID=1925024 RepID=UPI002D7A1AB3|nr:hypothetical protein [Intrasporangium sp.]HET7397652.1 hypothetical protein [Intrasporangium sp.]
MTSPRMAEATARGRYYRRPGSDTADLISVTNVLSVGCAKPALVPWAAKIAAEYAIEHQGALMARSRTDRDGAVKAIKEQVTVARDKAADLGSRIHALAEAHALGTTLATEDGDDEAEKYVAQYRRFLDDFDIDLDKHVEATELTVASPAKGVAGTLDQMLWLPLDGYLEGESVRRLPDGERALWVVDTKTSATRPATSVYGEYALQLTALRWMSEMWLPDGTIERFPSERIKGAAVLNLRRSSYELIPVPTGPAERAAFDGCLTLAKWMHSTGHDINGGEYRPVGPSGKAKPKRTTTRKAA